MKRVKRFVTSLPLLVAFVAIPAFAAAPKSPDAQYESFDGQDTIIKDRKTKLDWERRVLKDSIKSVAEFDCANAGFGGSGLGRLPTIKELLTIFDEEPHREYQGGRNIPKNLDQDAFGDDFSPVDLPYWSQTPGATAGTFWTLNFTTGVMEERLPSLKAHTRCVRG